LNSEMTPLNPLFLTFENSLSSMTHAVKMKCKANTLESNIQDKYRRNTLCLLELCTHVGVYKGVLDV